MCGCSVVTMTSAGEILMLRKQLLQARGMLYRLQLQQDAGRLRRAAGIAHIAGAAFRALPLRLMLLGLVLGSVPAARLSGGARILARGMQFAGIAARGLALWQLANRRTVSVRQRTDRMVIDA